VTRSVAAPDPPASGPPNPRWHAAWSAALDDLEMDVGRAEALLTADHVVREAAVEAALVAGGWTPPTALVRSGQPLPADLAERAQALVDRQRRTAVALSKALTASRRELKLLHRMNPGAATPPVYHDKSV
jgi:hypothetical protein